MSLPQDRLLPICNPAGFLSPDDRIRVDRTIDYELGGIALQNISQGLKYQIWTIEVQGSDVVLYPENDPTNTIILFTESFISEIALAFDQLMNVVVTYVASGTAKLRWYNTNVENYVTTTLSGGSRSPVIALDDKRANATSTGNNDILVFYIRGNTVYYVQQRDLYGVERVLYNFTGTSNTYIRRVGMDSNDRMRLELFELPQLPECVADPVVNGTEYPHGQEVTVQSSGVRLLNHYAPLSGVGVTVSRGTLVYTPPVIFTVPIFGVVATANNGILESRDRTVVVQGQSITVDQDSVGALGGPAPSGVNAEYTVGTTVVSEVATSVNVSGTLSFLTTGVCTYVGGESVNNFTWLAPTGVGASADFEVYLSVVSSGGVAFSGSIPLNTWTTIPSTKTFITTATLISVGLQIKTAVINVQVRPVGTSPKYDNPYYYRNYNLTLTLILITV